MNISVSQNRGGYSTNYSYSISLIRAISLLLIIACHIMQYEDYFLAWWFNVGVQIFLCISGFLYGQREIGELTEFYKKRFTKILIPYYIVFIIAGVSLFLFERNEFSISKFLVGLFCRTTISGGQHLWFVSCILVCYILLPILYAYKKRYITDKRSFLITAIASLALAITTFSLYAQFINAAWIVCFLIGYWLGVNATNRYLSKVTLIIITTVCMLVFNGCKIYIDYAWHVNLTEVTKVLYGYITDFGHVFLGIWIFQMLLQCFSLIKFRTRICKLLSITDEYSYETYLVHHFLIIGPFSLMAITPIVPLNILVILIGIVLLALILKRMETIIMKLFGY